MYSCVCIIFLPVDKEAFEIRDISYPFEILQYIALVGIPNKLWECLLIEDIYAQMITRSTGLCT